MKVFDYIRPSYRVCVVQALWILDTDCGTKRTYAPSAYDAKLKAMRYGLMVRAVRAGAESDFPENICATMAKSRTARGLRRKR